MAKLCLIFPETKGKHEKPQHIQFQIKSSMAKALHYLPGNKMQTGKVSKYSVSGSMFNGESFVLFLYFAA
jgi:hypothetical protein